MTIIAYKDNNGIGIVFPASSAFNEGWTLETIAQKDVPAGAPYVFIDDESEVDYIDWDKANTALGASLFWSIQASAEQAKEETAAQATALNAKNQPSQDDERPNQPS